MITTYDIMNLNSYYSHELISKLFAKKESLTATDILTMPISSQDRLWLALREGILPEKIIHEFAYHETERALARERSVGREPDPRILNAIVAKRKWLNKEIDDAQLAAAGYEARKVAKAAECDRSRAVTLAAAWTASAEGWEAVRAVRLSRIAVCADTKGIMVETADAIWNIEGEQQCERLLAMLTK